MKISARGDVEAKIINEFKTAFQGGRVQEQLLYPMFFHLGKSLDDCTFGGYIMEILDLHMLCLLPLRH